MKKRFPTVFYSCFSCIYVSGSYCAILSFANGESTTVSSKNESLARSEKCDVKRSSTYVCTAGCVTSRKVNHCSAVPELIDNPSLQRTGAGSDNAFQNCCSPNLPTSKIPLAKNWLPTPEYAKRYCTFEAEMGQAASNIEISLGC